ncbi:hypothetical protein [Asanoa siamensis]|uniref:Uncharacterized protein n=1 Tax=Asanoa siamensis TaxID=926357 RepID=A0ABQ4D446_9ACTN|nr:hypothetical protein [Asanoa siamensis]GIF78313.1 hypothetical protein Asi02nite_78310 [Asanoa siamensis]
MSADVFVDRTGRRRRILTWVAVASGALLVSALGLLAAGLLAGGPLPLAGWTGDGPGTPGRDAAVIGPAPVPPPPVTQRATAPSSRARPSVAATPRPSAATASATDRPGRGVGRGNKPTAKPDHPRPKAG